MSIDIQEAIKRSLQTEKNAMNFYQLGAKLIKDDNARRAFEILAKEEREHASQFYKLYTGGDIPSFDEFMNAVADDESSWMVTVNRSVSEEFTEKKALELAIEKEKNLEEALRATAAKINDPAIKAVYESNANETLHHLEMIEAEYAHLMGMVHESEMDTFVRE